MAEIIATNKDIARLKGVRQAVHAEGRKRRDTARANFRPHNNPRGHKIFGASKGLNYEFGLEGEAPGAVEFGHHNNRSGEWVEGLFILSKAARE